MHDKKPLRMLPVALFAGALAFANVSFAQWDPEFMDGKFHPIWNKKDFTNWKAHSSNWGIGFPGTDSATIELDGKARPSGGGMTHLIYGKKITGNMEARVVARMPTTSGANTGFQWRSRCRKADGTLDNACGGSPWEVCGPQSDMGASYSGDIYNGCTGFYITSSTQNAPPKKINNLAACRASTNLKTVAVWNEYGVRIHNDTAWTSINGINCTRLLLEQASEKSATTQGLISLQYESAMKVEFKTVELRNLDVVPNGLSTRPVASAFAVRGGVGSVSFAVPEAGKYSVRIADMRGKVVKTHSGTGPVAQANLPLGASGMYLAEIRSPSGAFTTKFIAD
ncbi:MAG: family 16 glycoside hydrolase [Fibrobacteria bacterium]